MKKKLKKTHAALIQKGSQTPNTKKNRNDMQK